MKRIFFKKTPPTKTIINLARASRNPARRVRLAAGLAAGVAALGLFGWFGVYSRFAAAQRVQEECDLLRAQIAQLQQTTQDYEALQEEYRKATGDYLSSAEAAEPDRLAVLDLVEQTTRGLGQVERITIEGTSVNVHLSETSLDQVSRIIAALQENEQVSFVTVSTAGTEQDGSVISADVQLELRPATSQQGGNGQ